MNRIIKILIILLCIALVISICHHIITKNKNKEIEEYEPEEEISDAQERQTLISLYFLNKTTGGVEPEARLMDVKELVRDPYMVLLNMLIEGPKNNSLQAIIPNGTKVNNVTLNNDTLVIDFSGEFTMVSGKEMEEKVIDSIVKTLTELTEVNSIKIVIDGEENKAFEDGEVTFEMEFIRED